MPVTSGSYTNFPQGFANGVSVRGMPLLQSNPGQVFFVGNGPVLLPNQRAGSNGNRGTFLDPFSTLAYGLSACSQGRGDIIFVMSGHKETLSNATALAMNTAGVAIIGLGAGSLRPQFTLDTATTANIPVRATNMSIQNCVFLANFLSIASTFTGISASFTGVIALDGSDSTTALMTASSVTGTIYPGAACMGTGVKKGTFILSQVSGTTGGAGVYRVNIPAVVGSTTITTGPHDFAIDNCEFRDLSSVLSFLSVFTSSATANASDGFNFTRNAVWGLGTVSPTVALTFAAAQDRLNLSDNVGSSPITAVTQGPVFMAAGANNMTNITIARNRFYRPNTSASLPVGISASGTGWTGHAFDNYFWAVPSGTGIWISTGTKVGLTNNFSPITGAYDKNAIINPAQV